MFLRKIKKFIFKRFYEIHQLSGMVTYNLKTKEMG